MYQVVSITDTSFAELDIRMNEILKKFGDKIKPINISSDTDGSKHFMTLLYEIKE